MSLAARLRPITPSLTLSVSSQAKAMRAAGQPVWDLSAGEPDFDTPEPIKAAAKLALDRGMTKYGPAAGLPELRAALAAKLQQDNGLRYAPEQVMVTNGGKHALFNLMMVLLEGGDEAIIPSPYWVSYPEMVKLAGATPVLVPADVHNDYKITPAQLAAAITPQTKLFVLNSPGNPTGSVYTPAEVKALAAVLAAHPQVWVVSDEIYEKIRYDGATHFSIAACPELFDRTLIANGFAKAYSMTGWRVGYLAGPTAVIAAATMVQGHSTSNVCTFAQYGAIAAVTGSQEGVAAMTAAFAERREIIYERVRTIPGLVCPKPAGAFYLFPDIGALGLDSRTFCEKLLQEEGVAIVPGIAFGADTNVRLSYATDRQTIEEACDRLGRFVSRQR
ncbi:MAG: pyridoxal phosphate-dependent aminotransferase [Oscillatoriales cyanobacterium SM2_1_8]|nr:pyridoxal phosphate-dependent aminotransferase [Oscillatoriales cyanobacterium SM2_1_8]